MDTFDHSKNGSEGQDNHKKKDLFLEREGKKKMSESFKPLHPDEGCYPGCWLELRLAICLLCTPVLHVRS